MTALRGAMAERGVPDERVAFAFCQVAPGDPEAPFVGREAGPGAER